MALVDDIKAWANKHYETSYGASVIVECYTDAEIEQEFNSVADAQEFAELQDDRKADVCAEF